MKKVLAILVIASAVVACNNKKSDKKVEDVKDTNTMVNPDTTTMGNPDTTTMMAPDTTTHM